MAANRTMGTPLRRRAHILWLLCLVGCCAQCVAGAACNSTGSVAYQMTMAMANASLPSHADVVENMASVFLRLDNGCVMRIFVMFWQSHA